MNEELEFWKSKNNGNSRYDVTDKYCVVVTPGVLETIFDTKEEAIDAATDYILSFENCDLTEEEIRKQFKENGYVDGSGACYASIYNTISKRRELAVDCYLYIDMLPGETEQEAYDRLVNMIPDGIEINLGHKEVRDIV